MSMSTDNNPIEPVVFHAIDAETSTKLMINHFIRPFVVVPKESKKDLTTVLVTSPGVFNFKIFVNIFYIFRDLGFSGKRRLADDAQPAASLIWACQYFCLFSSFIAL